MAKRRTMIVMLSGAAIAAVLLLVTRTSEPPILPAGASASARPEVRTADGLAVSATGVRIYPQSSVARVALTPDPADAALLDGILLADQFDSLLARARREPAFAHVLAHALHTCTTVDRSSRWLDITLRVRNDQGDERALERFDATFSKCRGLETSQLDERIGLGERAARAGVLEAQLAYTNYVDEFIVEGSLFRPTGRYRDNAEAFIMAAARSGEPEGLYAAYHLYQYGALAPQDLVRAYRYAEQYARLRPGSTSQHMLERLTRRMTPDELRRARAR